MDNVKQVSERIIYNLLHDKISLENLIKWLKNIRSSAPIHGLFDENENISQFKFIIWFLNHIRDKASQIINERRPKVAVGSAAASSSGVQEVELRNIHRNVSVSNDDTNLRTLGYKEDVYLREFPGLSDLPSKKGHHKTHKRIKPTTVKNEKTCHSKEPLLESKCGSSKSNSLPSSLNVRNEELLSKRFVSKKDKSQKPLFTPLDITITYKNDKSNFIAVNNETNFDKLDKLIDLYDFLLTNYLVPNITNEIRFILNVFDYLTENDFPLTQSKTNTPDAFLNSEDEWKHFCISIIFKQEHLISKLEFNILNFIVKRMSLFTSEIPASYTDINKDIVFAESVCAFHNRLFKVNRLSVNDFLDENEYSLFCDLSKKFLETEKHWYNHRSEEILWEDMKNLFESSESIQFYFLGQLFVSCLVKTIEGSITYGSNSEQKLVQLNTRLTKPSHYNDLEPDFSFHSNELFFKFWLDYCLIKCPIFVHYAKYWFIYTISALTKDVHKELGSVLFADLRSTLLWSLKIKITIAKFLGYVEFYFNRNNKLSGDEKNYYISIQSEVLPAFDLKSFIIEATKTGSLVLTIPWIVEYLCMADSSSAFVPYYRDILLALISIFLSSHIRPNDDKKGANIKTDLLRTSILIPHKSLYEPNESEFEGSNCLLNESSRVFLLIWIGRLFDTKVFGESIFLDTVRLYKKKISRIKFKSCQLNRKTAIDCAEIVKRDFFLFCCSHFSKMKYWENSSPSYVKNIRPITLDSEHNKGSPADIHDILEACFFDDHEGLNTLITFICDRMSSNCQKEISKILSLSSVTETGSEKRTYLKSPEIEEEEEESSPLVLFKASILEVINGCGSKIQGSLECLASPDISSAVIQTCVTIASKKLKGLIKDWLMNEGFCLDEIDTCLTIDDTEIKTCIIETNPNEEIKEVNECHVPIISSAFIDIHRIMREINSGKSIPKNLDPIVKEFHNISIQLHENYEKQILKDLYILSWDFVFLLVSNHYKEISSDFFREMVNFWKNNHYGNNEERVLSPRIIKAASFKKVELQQIIALNLAKLILNILEEEMITSESVETQSVAILRHTWAKKELHFIKMCMTTLCELLESASVLSSAHILSTVECIIDSVNDMLSLE